MSLFDFLPWSNARKEKKQQEREQFIRDKERSYERLEKNREERRKAGCLEIYDAIMRCIEGKKEKDLETILRKAPPFNMDFRICGSQTILTLLAWKYPNISPNVFQLILDRHPNPFLRNQSGETAQDILREKYDFKYGKEGHIMYSMLEEYKIQYCDFLKEQQNTSSSEKKHSNQNNHRHTDNRYSSVNTTVTSGNIKSTDLTHQGEENWQYPPVSPFFILRPATTIASSNTSDVSVCRQQIKIRQYTGNERTN